MTGGQRVTNLPVCLGLSRKGSPPVLGKGGWLVTLGVDLLFLLIGNLVSAAAGTPYPVR